MIIGKETEKIEFKLTTGELKEACESICAILNKHKSGELYFGVDDSGYVKGQSVSDNTIKDVAKGISELVEPKISPSIESYAIDGKKIIKVSFIGNNRPYSVKGDRKRVEIPEIPEMALREIIVNSFAHASYDNLPEIEINIHPKKIEIYNPGSFPEGLTPLDFINRNLPSYKRNRLILDVLFRSKDVEKSGTGFQRVNELCKESGINWTYRIEGAGFFFDFVRAADANYDPINDPINNVIKTEGYAKDDRPKLSKLEIEVLKLIKKDLTITRSQIVEKVGKSEATAKRTLNSLQAKGLIAREGSKKTGCWKVLNIRV